VLGRETSALAFGHRFVLVLGETTSRTLNLRTRIAGCLPFPIFSRSLLKVENGLRHSPAIAGDPAKMIAGGCDGLVVLATA
jgi:hypothetical protein